MSTTPTEILRQEHRVIERVLGALESFVDRLPPQPPPGARGTLGQFAAFFRQFADRWHHGKEEARLFAALHDHGFPREYGPVAVMLAEHEAGREHVRALARVAAGAGPLTAEETETVSAHAREFAALLRAHIQKEDHVLFPLADQALPPEVIETLAGSFAAFEQEAGGAAEHAKYCALAGELAAAYPPDPSRPAAPEGCFVCGGHR